MYTAWLVSVVQKKIVGTDSSRETSGLDKRFFFFHFFFFSVKVSATSIYVRTQPVSVKPTRFNEVIVKQIVAQMLRKTRLFYTKKEEQA